jgi:hypothetical protein
MDRKARYSVLSGPSIRGGTGSGRPTGLSSTAGHTHRQLGRLHPVTMTASPSQHDRLVHSSGAGQRGAAVDVGLSGDYQLRGGDYPPGGRERGRHEISVIARLEQGRERGNQKGETGLMCAAMAVFTADPDRGRGADNADPRRGRGRKKQLSMSSSVKRLNLTRRLALTQDGRRAAIGTLASADVLLIWLSTEHGATARDRLTHRTAAAELQARGLFGTGWPGPQSFSVPTAG